MLGPFLFADAPPSGISPLSLHDALPISDDDDALEAQLPVLDLRDVLELGRQTGHAAQRLALDRKSTRLNSSHVRNSYAVFCLKKKDLHGLSRVRDGFVHWAGLVALLFLA